MPGTIWFLFWQFAGGVVSAVFFKNKRLSLRLWLGSVFGTLLSMWMPIPFAFFLGFTVKAHIAAAAVGAVLTALLCIFPVPPPELTEDAPLSSDKPFALLLPPFMVLSVVLVLSHVLNNINGVLYTGQCTYGDMPMHLSFISSMAAQGIFPFEYNLLPGVRLCYPFLCDSVSASMYLLGSSLRWAYMLPVFFAFCQVFCGVWFLAKDICESSEGGVWAFIFFFLNGGLGLIYVLRDYSFHEMLHGFYVTPTNLTDLGFRWVNVIADMLLPQRATLFGWAAVFAALYMLYRAVFQDERAMLLPAGIVGGLLPMVHTHSFFALGLTAFCWLVVMLVRDGFNRETVKKAFLFGLPAVFIALPQLLFWTFRSVSGNASFLRIGLDWVNEFRENWLWFWFKNVGIVLPLTAAGFIFTDKRQRCIFSGAVLIFVIGEIFLFQPNPYDNNKLFYIAYFFGCCLSARLVVRLKAGISSLTVRRLAAGLLLAAACSGAFFTLVREAVSGTEGNAYVIFDKEEQSAADYISEYIPADCVFLTWDEHLNVPAVLCGRNIICGSPSYLYYHGVDYADAHNAAYAMLTDEYSFEQLREKYGVDYVYMGSDEQALPGELETYLRANYLPVFDSANIRIYKIR